MVKNIPQCIPRPAGGLGVFVLLCTLALCLLAEPAHALLYRTPVGSLKDNCVIHHEGTFYLYTMYRKAKQKADILDQWHHVWCATSTDGVHWKDVGPVIQDAPFIIFAMRVWKAGDRFIMNHGSFTDGKQDVLKFWESKDLIHWTYLGPEYDVRRPDGQRIDHMSVLTQEEDGKTAYYGYAVGGMLRSEDGVKWKWVMDYPFTDDLNVRVVQEPGGIERLGDTYYLLVGGFFPGSFGYAVATYTSKEPMGPFSPDYPAFRLNGYAGRHVVALWASFCRTPKEVVMANYILDPGGTYWWHPPLKTAVTDDGHLRMGYWKGNEALKGTELPVILSQSEKLSKNPGTTIAPAKDKLAVHAPINPHVRWLNSGKPSLALAMMSKPFDLSKGIILEGTMRVAEHNRVTFPAVGLCIEEEGSQGTAVLFQTSEETNVGRLDWSKEEVEFTSQDRTGYGCATVAGIPEKETCSFRILFRENIFECYLNDLLVQTFFTTKPTGRFGFVVQDGDAVFENIRAWEMDL